MAECENAYDCFDSVTNIQKDCYERAAFSNLSNFCDCEVEIGWIGDDCDEVSPLLIFRRVAHIVCFAVTTCLTVLSFKTLLMTLLLKGGQVVLFELDFLTGICTFIAALLFAVQLGIRLRGYYDPTFQAVFTFESFIVEDKVEVFLKNFIAVYNLSIFFTSFTYIAMLFFLQMFNELLSKLSRFTRSKHKVRRWSLIIKVIGFTWIILAAAMTIAGLQADTIIVLSAAGGILFTIIFPLFFLYLNNAFKKFAVTEVESIKRIISLVRRVGVSLILCNFLLSFILVSHTLAQEYYEENGLLGEISLISVLTDLWRYVMCLTIGLLTWFLNSISEATVLGDLYPRLCFIFRLWDKENRSIYTDQHLSPTGTFSKGLSKM